MIFINSMIGIDAILFCLRRICMHFDRITLKSPKDILPYFRLALREDVTRICYNKIVRS